MQVPDKKINKKHSAPRRRILTAARKVFTEKGMAGARTREIADLAGVNVAMVHYYFSSKENLYLQVVRPLLVMLAGVLKLNYEEAETPQDKLEGVVDAYFDFMSTHPYMPRLMMWEIVSGAKNLRKVFGSAFSNQESNIPTLLVKVFSEGIEAGILKEHQPVQSAVSMLGLCVFPFVARDIIDIAFPESPFSDDFLEVRRQYVKELLVKGLSS